MPYIKDKICDTVYGERISENMIRDNNGQLICENAILARTGLYDYRESELIEGGSRDKIVQVYRSPEEVFDPVSINSMNYKPLVNDHPEDNVTPDTVSELQKGFMINARRGEGALSNCLLADIVVTDPEVIDLILRGRKRDLSVGYTADIVEEGGRYVMKNIRGNHIALCEAGRAGNACIRDSKAVLDASVDNSRLEKAYGKDFQKDANFRKVFSDPAFRFEETGIGVYAFVARSGARVVTYAPLVRDLDDVYDGNFSLMENYFVKSVTKSYDQAKRFLKTGKVSDASSCFAVADAKPFREGQRVNYFGSEGEITEINLTRNGFMIEVGRGGKLFGRLPVDEFEAHIKKGNISILDSDEAWDNYLEVYDSKTYVVKHKGKKFAVLADSEDSAVLRVKHLLDASAQSAMRAAKKLIDLTGCYAAVYGYSYGSSTEYFDTPKEIRSHSELERYEQDMKRARRSLRVIYVLYRDGNAKNVRV